MYDKKHVLLLGSSSRARQELLHAARIPFLVITQTAQEESAVDASLDDRVEAIAREKMAAVEIPAHYQNQAVPVFVLTADTMVADAQGHVYGKPQSREDARRILLLKSKDGAYVATGFCCNRQHWDGNKWIIEAEHCTVVKAFVEYAFSEKWIDHYIEHCPHCLQAAGGLQVEGYGAQFIRAIHGSYTTVMGLPTAEVRETLDVLGFFE